MYGYSYIKMKKQNFFPGKENMKKNVEMERGRNGGNLVIQKGKLNGG